jgi:hypothetical protein
MVDAKDEASLTIPGSIEKHEGIQDVVMHNTDQAPYKFHHATSTWVTLKGPDLDGYRRASSVDLSAKPEKEINCYWDDAKGFASKKDPTNYAPGKGADGKLRVTGGDSTNRPYAMYCIVPSMYQRTDKKTGKKVTGSFYLSVYGDAVADQKNTVKVRIEKIWKHHKKFGPESLIWDTNGNVSAVNEKSDKEIHPIKRELIKRAVQEKWKKEDDGHWYCEIEVPSFELQGGSIIVEEAEAGTVRERFSTIAGEDVNGMDSLENGDENVPTSQEEKMEEVAEDDEEQRKEKEKLAAELESAKANTAKAIQFEEVREKIINIAEKRGIDHRSLMRMFDSETMEATDTNTKASSNSRGS